jgi:hypothetical protein
MLHKDALHGIVWGVLYPSNSGVLGSYFVCIPNTGATTDSEFFF